MFRRLLLVLALTSTVACSMPVAAGDLVQLDVVDRDNGQVLPEYRHRGQDWIAGVPGHRYSVRLTNTTGERVLVVLSVDGVNAVTGQTASPSQGGYVLEPWESAEIAGWRKSLDDIAQFVFTDLPDSYAARTGRPANVGVVGEGVDDFQVGDRVAICPTTPAGCPGSSFDGGFGPKIVVGTQALVRIPDEVDFVNGAAATDAGMTSYAAVVRRGGVKAGDRVGIIGLGGLGQIGARVAHLLGAEVHVAEIKEDIWPLAKELGAVDARQSITDYPKGFFDVIVDFAGFGDTTADAVDVIRLGGVVVLVGMGRLETTIDAKSLIVNQCDLRGSNGGTPDDIRGVYELMRTGKLTPVTTTVSFDEVPEAIERLERGDVVGRLVISYE